MEYQARIAAKVHHIFLLKQLPNQCLQGSPGKQYRYNARPLQQAYWRNMLVSE